MPSWKTSNCSQNKQKHKSSNMTLTKAQNSFSVIISFCNIVGQVCLKNVFNASIDYKTNRISQYPHYIISSDITIW